MDVRPPLKLRLRYIFGARLPDAYLGWVHTDLTAKGWAGRQLVKVCIQLSPFLVVLTIVAVLVPRLNAADRLLLIAILPVTSLFTAAMISQQLRDRRLRQHELPIPDDNQWGPPSYRY